MLRNFTKARLATNAVGPFMILKIYGKSALLKPLINIKNFPRYKQYNLKDIAPLEMEWDLEHG